MAKTKRPVRKGRKVSGSDVRRVNRIVQQGYYWRYVEDNQPGEMVTHFAYRGLIPPVSMMDVEFQLQNRDFFWHCVTITYYRDQWGKKYRRFGFAKLGKALKAGQQSLRPMITAAMTVAEEKGNSKQIYARGVVMAPWSKEFPDLIPLVRKQMQGLKLTSGDIEEIKDYLHEEMEIMEYDPTEVEDVDRQIANLL